MTLKRFLLVSSLSLLCSSFLNAGEVYLSELDMANCQQGWGQPGINVSVDGNKLTIGGEQYDKGLGTHSDSAILLQLDGKVKGFTAKVGVDSETGRRGSVRFVIYADNKKIYSSELLKGGQPAAQVAVDLSGVRELLLLTTAGDNGIEYDHANWAQAKFEYEGAAPITVPQPVEEKYILTPPAPSEPRINSASIFGVRPGSPVLYTIAATGERPMEFAAKGLPKGVTIDEKTGQITGQAVRGSYKVTLIAKNKLGKATKELTLEVGDKIALTPPMGWNSWNCWGCAIDEAKIRDSAQWLVKSGLINHGWQYINIDDCWMKKLNTDDEILGGTRRDEQGYILTNKHFPDMRVLTDYIHGLGLKAGIYISPGPSTCAGFEGSYKYEKQDAEIFAAWGFDYLKYDWCGYGSIVPNPDLVALKLPYIHMAHYLAQQPRDIVYSLCQYGMGEVWQWGGEVGGNCWRTTGDIVDTWGSMAGIGFDQAKCTPFAKPGNWNDPDMLVVGKVGWGPNLHDTRLTPNEQYTHISLWSLLASPLLIGCDLSQLDDFTLNLLTNDEVIAVNQDPLGVQASRKIQTEEGEVWVKPLADGSYAVGLFNRGYIASEMEADFAALGIKKGKYEVRDLWRQQDLGNFKGSFKTQVPRHGVVLVKVTRK